jgi:hypothetical protein
MEQVQVAQFLACVAAAGCHAMRPTVDDGADWVVSHRSIHHKIGRTARIDVQLKSTSRLVPPLGAHVPFPVDSRTFEWLTEPSHNPQLLIVCVLPTDPERWVYADVATNTVQLRHLSYWAVVRPEDRTGTTQTTVHIPTAQVFDDLALCEIMRRVGRGEEL